MSVDRRSVCSGLAALAALGPSRLEAAGGFDAMVRHRGGTHDSLAAALAAAPPGDRPWRILLGRGKWEEKLAVRRPNLVLVGEDRRTSVLSASAAAGQAKPGGGSWGTYGSATLTVEAPGFVARNLTIENGFDYVANLRDRRVEGAQAVALALGDAADRSVIESVDLLGHQDTFYLRAGRAAVRDCLIAGSIDFIFGGAAALFERCEIRSRLRPGETLQGYVAAPSTPRAQPIGFVFDHCRLTREPGLPDGSVWLGRPWRAGGNPALLGAAAWLDCWMDAHVAPEGWTWMGYKGPGGYPMRLEPGDARFFEYRSRGPGGGRHAARRQLGDAQAARFRRVLGDWRP
ncbi:pectin esterase [Sphingomonas parva]|uniref:Pectinesterase n=1 Tax=Sphingomonas parva TaxID=2555898 RepID=A0A4Y8ZRS6_9SPHN|nr:pectinesterase family protein [Sphingomonas parva]TFI58177.1 pectin esterase [Sphingomonas parva]